MWTRPSPPRTGGRRGATVVRQCDRGRRRLGRRARRPALAALRWSAAKAEQTRARVVAVHAWLPTASLRAPAPPPPGG
ncbi:hypothetical protein [Streptomyces sp. NPDC048172]|uniref:hypothetical protein n=1 Tax=Streptomyces sp. NPDC048172 TaxID=3365505 RepID=UPI0037179ED1